MWEKMLSFCGSFRRVYRWKQSDDHRPQPLMRSMAASSGNIAIVLGMPARNEWHVILLTPGTQMSASSSDSVLLNWPMVRFFPDPKRNTGAVSS